MAKEKNLWLLLRDNLEQIEKAMRDSLNKTG